jgi:hypothetical protein
MLSKVFVNTRSFRRAFTVAATAVVTSFVGATLPATASAQIVDFETLGYGPSCQWGGGSAFSSLSGKTWDGFRPLDLNNLSNVCGRSSNTGYSSLLTPNVGNVIATGSGGAWLSSFNPFRLNSLVAGAGWLNPTKLTLSFYLNTQLMSTSVLSLNTSQTGATTYSGFYTGPTDYIGFMPDYSNGVDVFNSLAESCLGATGPCTPETYKTWFVDNLDFTPMFVVVTPEPGSFVLMGLGLAVVAGVVRRRRRV